MRIWLVTIGEPLPIDANGADRLFRAGILATMLTHHGNEVVWWSSTFDHVRKRHRFSNDASIRLNSGILLKLLHGCGYARNVSLRRLADHVMLARNFTRQAQAMPRPDVILCSLPPLDLPRAVTHYGKANGVPVILDVRDLWPDILAEIVPRWVRPLSSPVFTWMRHQATTSCRNAFAITGHSPRFVEWGLRHARRSAGALDRCFPFGYEVPVLTNDERKRATHFWSRYGLHQGDTKFTVCFFGTFSNQFDFETIVDAALLLEEEEIAVRFVLCGTGEHLEILQARARGSQAVIFPGWVGRAEIWMLMALSDVGIAPYRNHAGFDGSWPNKSIEYLAGGLPIVSSLQGRLEELLNRTQCGVTYTIGDVRGLRDLIVHLMVDSAQLRMMSKNSLLIFHEMFAAEKVYGAMLAYFQDVVATYSVQAASQKAD